MRELIHEELEQVSGGTVCVPVVCYPKIPICDYPPKCSPCPPPPCPPKDGKKDKGNNGWGNGGDDGINNGSYNGAQSGSKLADAVYEGR